MIKLQKDVEILHVLQQQDESDDNENHSLGENGSMSISTRRV